MASNHKSLAGFSIILAMLACSVPGVVQPTLVGDQTVTVTAATIQEPTLDGSDVPPTATFSRTPSITVSPNGSPSATITPTYSVPMLIVQESTNCRTGPGEDYEVVSTYLAGKQLEIVGRYDPGDFWLVKSSESPGGTCWLWGQYVEVTGSYWVVSSVTPPPTGTNPPPEAVAIDHWEFFCTGTTINVTILWFDRADNEQGYRVMRNGGVAAELPANSTIYTESFTPPEDLWTDYYVQIYNEAGSANSSIMRMSCS